MILSIPIYYPYLFLFNLLHSPYKWNSKVSVKEEWILYYSISARFGCKFSGTYPTFTVHNFLDRSQPGERTIYTNRLWTRTSVVPWSTRARREFQERVVDSSVAMRWPRTLSLTILSLFLQQQQLSLSLPPSLSVFLATCFWSLPPTPDWSSSFLSFSSWTSIIYSCGLCVVHKVHSTQGWWVRPIRSTLKHWPVWWIVFDGWNCWGGNWHDEVQRC